MVLPLNLSPPPDLAVAVLAAGFGTRLHPITHTIAKPLLPVGDSPLLGQTLIKLKQMGFEKLAVNASYRSCDVERYISTLPFAVQVSPEETILGTAGGIRKLSQLLDSPRLLIVNGDICGDIDLRPLWQVSSETLTMALKSLPLGQGTVGVGSQGQVVRLRGEVFGEEVSSGDYLGIGLLGASALASLPPQGCLVGDWALPQLRQGLPVETCVLPATFLDIGTPRELLEANLAFLTDAGLNSWTAPEAKLNNQIQLKNSVICAHAKVLGQGLVEDCLILPGAQAEAPLRRVIVAPTGEILSCL